MRFCAHAPSNDEFIKTIISAKILFCPHLDYQNNRWVRYKIPVNNHRTICNYQFPIRQGSVIGETILRDPRSLSGQMTHSHGHLVWLCPHRICWGQSIDVNIYPVTKYEKAEGCEDPHIIFGVGGGGVGGRERYFRWSDVTVSVCVTMYDFFLRQPCKYEL